MDSKTTTRNKVIFYTSLGCSSFLLLLYLNYTFFKLDHVLVGVFHEMFILPCAAIQPFLVFISAKDFYNKNYKLISYSFFSLIISSITLIAIVAGFLE